MRYVRFSLLLFRADYFQIAMSEFIRQLVLAEIATASHLEAGDRRLFQAQLNMKQVNIAYFQAARVSPWFDPRKVFKADLLL